MTDLMNKSFGRFTLAVGIAVLLAGCGNKETREALQKSGTLEQQKQYDDANRVLIEALRAREAKIDAENPTPSDQTSSDALTSKVQADPEILKMERAQIPLYLHLERPDLAWAVYTDILKGSPDDSAVYDTLHDSDPVMRSGAVRVLGLAGDAKSISAMAQTTKDSDKDVRRAAVSALGTIKDPQTVQPLIDALGDSYWFVRSEAASALALEHDPRAIKPLLNVVADSDDTVESAAETALLSLARDPGASVDDFAARLNDPNQKIALIAANGLALLKDPRAIPALMKLAADPDPKTRLEAIRGLGQSGDPSVTPTLLQMYNAAPDPDTRLEVVKALGRTGDPAGLPTLRQTLKDPDANIKGWSIIALGRYKDEASLPDLKNIEADESEPDTVRAAASAAIDNITGQAPPPSGP
jgi:HEAT repeat protein